MGAHSSNNRKAHAPRVPARRVWALLCVLVAALLAGAHGQVEPAEVAVQQDVVVLDAASPARAYLLNTTGSGAGGGQGAPPSARRPALAYAKPGGYEEAADDANLGEAMKLPAEKNGLKLSRWVVCSWQIANISATEITSNKQSLLRLIPQMLATFENVAADQVLAVAAANVSMGFLLSGVDTGSSGGWSDASISAMQGVASSMAGGYDPSLITVSSTAPVAEGQAVRDQMLAALTAPPVVVKRGKDLGPPGAAGAGAPAAAAAPAPAAAAPAPGGRRMLAQLHTALATPANSPARRAAHARSLRQQAGAARLPMYLTYVRVAPDNTSTLLDQVCSACQFNTSVPLGTDVSQQPCGQETKAALAQAGVRIDEAAYAQLVYMRPTVSLSVRLAVGLTPGQVAAGVDTVLAQWLSEPSTAREMANMYTPDAVIKWLHTPEIWYQKSAARPAGYISPGAAVGVAVGGAAFICTVVGFVAWVALSRRRKQAAAAAGDKPDDAASSSSGRRRRRQGKRRYLLPDPPAPDAAAASAAAAAATAAAAGPSGVGHGDDDDGVASHDQARPVLRSVGDSVTSAIRYEQDDDEERSDGVGGAGEGSQLEAAPSSSSSAVLRARAALLAEYRQQQAHTVGSGIPGVAGATGAAAANAAAAAASAAAAAGRRSSCELADLRMVNSGTGGSSCANAVMPAHTPACAPSGGLASAVELSSALSPQPTDATDAAETQQQQQQQQRDVLQPVDARAAAASAAAVAAAAALPDSSAAAPSASAKPSPFAVSYDFRSCGLEARAGARTRAASNSTQHHAPPGLAAGTGAGADSDSGPASSRRVAAGAGGVALQDLHSVPATAHGQPPAAGEQQPRHQQQTLPEQPSLPQQQRTLPAAPMPLYGSGSCPSELPSSSSHVSTLALNPDIASEPPTLACIRRAQPAPPVA